MKMTKEIEEFLNLAITEHMGKAYTEEFFYRLGLKDGMKLKKCMKQILKALS